MVSIYIFDEPDRKTRRDRHEAKIIVQSRWTFGYSIQTVPWRGWSPILTSVSAMEKKNMVLLLATEVDRQINKITQEKEKEEAEEREDIGV